MAEEVVSVVPAAATPLVNDFSKLYNDEATSDVTFVVGPNGKKFFAHRNILGAASDVFKTYFSSNWKKKKKNVKLQYLEEEVFENLLLYIYKNEAHVKGEHLLDVLELAHKYMVTSLIYALTCESTFSQYYSEHVWKYLTYATQVNNTELMIQCLEVIEMHTNFVLDLPDFMDMNLNVIALVASRSILTIEEIDLFQHFFKWSEVECQRRNPPLQVTARNLRKVMDPFIHKIRFPIMTLDEFVEVEETGILTGSEINLIKKAITSDKKNLSGFDFKPRHAFVQLPAKQKLQGAGYEELMPGIIFRANVNDLEVHTCVPSAFKFSLRNGTWRISHFSSDCERSNIVTVTKC